MIDSNGNQITTTEHQLECWADFLDKKFAGRPDEPSVVLDEPDEPETPKLTIDEIEESVKGLKAGKAAGPDGVPIEQYKNSRIARNELFKVLSSIWES